MEHLTSPHKEKQSILKFSSTGFGATSWALNEEAAMSAAAIPESNFIQIPFHKFG